MPPETDQDVLKLGVETGVDAAIADFQRLGKEGSKSVRLIDKTTKAYSKTLKGVATSGIGGMLGGVKKLVTAYQDYGKKVTRWNATIAREQAKLVSATGDQRAAIQKNIDKYKELRKERLKELKTEHGKGAMDALQGAGKMGKAGIKSGKGFFKAGSSLLKKDFESATQHAAKAIGDAMSSTKTLGKGVKKAGNIFWKYGDKKLADAHKKWGAGGIMNKMGAVKDTGMAGAAGAMGAMGKAMGPLLKGLSSLAPLLSMVSGAFGAIVKLMVDAEAQAKAMNKEILQVAGSSHQFYKYAQNGDVALQDMGDMLHSIREDATSLDNIKWGIKKEDHMAVLTTLAQEGVALDELQDQFRAVSKTADLAASEATSFGGAVHIAVAYSRQFGVSLQELTQFQGEMMTEMGSSLTEVETSFHTMTQSAAESGIAANKFFGIIRSVSADLNLYNSRMEDTVHTLTLLGKVMNPRNAQKFMQFAAQGLKGMSTMDRFRMNLMGGSKMGGLVTKDLNRKSNAAARDIHSQTGKDISGKDILDPTKKIADLLEGVAEKSKGALTDTIMQLRMDQSANKKGTYGSSSAAANLSQGAALQAMKNSLNIGGTGKLADRSGDLITEQLAQLNGISKENLDEMAKFEMSVDNQRDVLKKQLKKGGKEADKANDALVKAGITASQIDSASYDEIMETMDKNADENLTDAQKELKYAQETSQFTSTVSDKIEALLDFIMNQVYGIMGDIYDAISSIPGVDSDSKTRELVKLQVQAARSGNKELRDLASKATSPDELRKAMMDSQSAKGQTQAAYDVPGLLKKQADLQQKSAQSQDADEKKKLEGEMKANDQALEAARTERNKMLKGIDEQLGGGHTGGTGDKVLGALPGLDSKNSLRADRFGSAANGVLGGKQSADVQNALKSGEGLQNAMDKAKVSEEDQAKILDKIRSQLSPEQLMAVTAKATAVAADKAAAATPTTDTATAQTAAKPPAPPPEPKPPAGGKPPAAAQAATAKATENMADSTALATSQQADMVGTLDDVNHVLEQKGIKINKSFMRNEFWKQGQDAVLDATRQALFEYFLYKNANPEELAKGMAAGTIDPKTFSSNLANAFKDGKKGTEVQKQAGFAAGGVIPQPKSPDSVFVAAKPGETVVPRGGAGGGGAINMPINVNGPGGQELAGMMRSAAMNVVAEWKRKHKYT